MLSLLYGERTPAFVYVLYFLCAIAYLLVIIIGGADAAYNVFMFLFDRFVSLACGGVALIFLILSFIPKTRIVGRMGMLIFCYLGGILTWVSSAFASYAMWGGLALVIGILVVGIGVIPIGILASLFAGNWFFAILIILLFFGSRFFGKIAGLYTPKDY